MPSAKSTERDTLCASPDDGARDAFSRIARRVAQVVAPEPQVVRVRVNDEPAPHNVPSTVKPNTTVSKGVPRTPFRVCYYITEVTHMTC